MTSEHRPSKQNIDKQGYKLLTTSQAGELLGLAAGTIRNWCDQGRISYTRGEGGRRWISMAEVERLRSDNAYTTVSDAVNRMQAIIDDRDATIHDLISEKAGESKRNLEVIATMIGTLTQRLDRLERAKPPAIRINDKTIRHIAEVVLREAAQADVRDGKPTLHVSQKPATPTAELNNHTRVVSEDERNRAIGEINNR